MNLLPDAVSYLTRRVEQSVQTNRMSSSVAAWLLPSDILLEAARNSALQSVSNWKSQRRYRDVAELAFASQCGLLDGDGSRVLFEGLRWLSGRSPRVSGQTADFCTDPLSLLGFALVLKSQSEIDIDWLHTASEIAAQHFTDWHLSLLGLVNAALGTVGTIVAPEVRIVAYSKNLTNDAPAPEDKLQVVVEMKATTLAEVDDSHGAFILAAFHSVESGLPSISLHSATIADVADLLRELPRGLQRWTWEDVAKTSSTQPSKWHIDHEYHVQNLLWVLLSPIFPDAKYEEYAPAVGSVHPRLDIAIPSLKLILEAKFWRVKDGSGKMIRELAEDASLYFTTDAQYDSLVPFIWDEGARTEEHPQLISGLKSIKGIADAIIVSRPAKMTTEQTEKTKGTK